MKVFDSDGKIVTAETDAPVNDLTRAPRFMDELPDGILFIPIVIPAEDGRPRIALVNPVLMATSAEVTEKILAAVTVARQEFVDAGIARDQVQQEMIDQLLAMTQQLTEQNEAQNQQDQILATQTQVLTSQAQTLASQNQTLTTQGQTLTSQAQALAAHDAVLDDKTMKLSQIVATLQATIQSLQAKASVVKLGDVTLAQTATVAIAAGDRNLEYTVTGTVKDERVLWFPKGDLPAGYIIKGVRAPATDKVRFVLNAPLLALGTSYSTPVEVWAIR